MWNWISRACIPWPACTHSLYEYVYVFSSEWCSKQTSGTSNAICRWCSPKRNLIETILAWCVRGCGINHRKRWFYIRICCPMYKNFILSFCQALRLEMHLNRFQGSKLILILIQITIALVRFQIIWPNFKHMLAIYLCISETIVIFLSSLAACNASQPIGAKYAQ